MQNVLSFLFNGKTYPDASFDSWVCSSSGVEDFPLLGKIFRTDASKNSLKLAISLKTSKVVDEIIEIVRAVAKNPI